MPTQTVTFKEVADRIHDKLDELSKEIDLMEKAKKLNSALIENRIHETDLFQVKMELQFYNHYYSFINKQYLEREYEAKEESKNPEIGTVIQHNLMIYYLLEYGKIIRPDVNATKYAKFVRSLTGMSRESIRKNWTNATFQENTNPRKKDLKSIRAFFELIKAEGIIKMIDNDLAMKNRTPRDNDGKSD